MANNIEQLNEESLNKPEYDYGLDERVALALRIWTIRLASGGQTNTKVFWDRRKHDTRTPRLDHCTTLEALSDKEIVVTLNNWNIQSDKGHHVGVGEEHINPYLEWYWESI